MSHVAVQRGVKERLFHGRTGQREPLLHKGNTQHGVQRERWPTGLALWVVRRNQLNQGRPWNDLFYLPKKYLFAGFLELELELELELKIEVQGGLLHIFDFLNLGLHQAHSWGIFAEFP